MDNIKTSSDLINKAQIGKYAYQVISTPPVKPGIESDIINAIFALQTFIRPRKPKTSVIFGALRPEFQRFGEWRSVVHYRNVELYEKVHPENRKRSPRVNYDFMDLIEEIQDIWAKIPEEELKKIPKDASENLDTYLYGKSE